MAWTRNRTIIAAAGASVAGLAAALFTRRWWGARGEAEEPQAAAHSRGKTALGPVGQSGSARSAGPDAMRDPPGEWDHVDQSSDESYPASDPPGVGSHVD
jgi:hypothetical protein